MAKSDLEEEKKPLKSCEMQRRTKKEKGWE